MDGGLRKGGIFKHTSPDIPLISIITVVYNRVNYLEQAILSVLNQTYNNIEYLIIDGGSTDGTLEIIKKYDNSIDYWISEADNGIYHAMNKGIRLTTGEIIGLLNSDDFYFPCAIEKLVRNYTKTNSGVWYGKQMRFEEYDDFCNFRIQEPILENMYERPSIYHAACFVHQSVYKTIGLFDQRYKIISDYDFLLKAIENGVVFTFINVVFTGFRSGGISGSAKAWIESYTLIREHPRHKANWFYITRNLVKKSIILRLLSVNLIKKYVHRKRKKEIMDNAEAICRYRN